MGLVPALTPFVPGTKIMASAVDAKFDAIVAVVNGNIDDSNIGEISASKVTSGEFHIDRIPDLDADKITSGTLSASRIPGLSASKITSGTLSASRIPGLSASKITSGTLSASRIPDLSASKITSGTLSASRIPDLSAAKITSGTMSLSRVSGLGTAATHDVTTSATDTTPGRLLKVRDFGIGSHILLDSSDNLNNVTTPGFYRHTAGSVPSNAPKTEAGYLQVWLEGGNYAMQIWYDRQNGNEYNRVKKAGTWQPWQELHHTGNIKTSTGNDNNFPMSQKAATDAFAPKTTTQEVTVESIPRGSTVKIDGVVVGETPVTVQFPVGYRQVEISSPGYVPYRGGFVLKPWSKTTISARLTSA